MQATKIKIRVSVISNDTNIMNEHTKQREPRKCKCCELDALYIESPRLVTHPGGILESSCDLCSGREQCYMKNNV